MVQPTLAMVVAIAANGVIGARGGLPWHLSSDLKRFKRDTMGKVVVMGRKTWESIGRPLPGRLNVVVTRNNGFEAEGAEVAASLDDALKVAHKAIAAGEFEGEVCVIGGGELYRQALERADRLYITHVLLEPHGDTVFPEIIPSDWKPVFTQRFEADEKDDAATIYTVYERVTNAKPA